MTIILHIPHAGTRFFPDQQLHAETFLRNAEGLIDYFTDELFPPEAPAENIIPVVFPYCRTACDVERLADDPLEQINLGIQYDRWPDRRKHGFLIAQGEEYLSAYTHNEYHRHHRQMEELLSRHPGALLIDCHSFSSRPSPLLPDPKAIEAYDICIGFNEDPSKPHPDLIGKVIQHFVQCGYRVGINTPFSNSKTFDTTTPYTSIMIEVNKRIYMDETTLRRTPNFTTLHHQLMELYGVVDESIDMIWPPCQV